MAYQSLYRRYRSQNFEQIKGQPHVTQALRTAIKEGRHSHAYLFSGPRGTGKTSTARVLAKALNCNNLQDGEPCTTCTSCIEIEQGKSFDLHELDAASNNKVDDVRDLIAKVALGSPGRTKVYILDEVHMLTSGAENALLKTLEEPPDHVVFVLATTEPHKVVSTIRSRTQHFEFHLLPGDDLEEHLRFVIDDAGLDVDQDGIEYALRQGGGSARDTLSALDLVAAAGGVPEGTNVGHDLAKALVTRTRPPPSPWCNEPWKLAANRASLASTPSNHFATPSSHPWARLSASSAKQPKTPPKNWLARSGRQLSLARSNPSAKHWSKCAKPQIPASPSKSPCFASPAATAATAPPCCNESKRSKPTLPSCGPTHLRVPHLALQSRLCLPPSQPSTLAAAAIQQTRPQKLLSPLGPTTRPVNHFSSWSKTNQRQNQIPRPTRNRVHNRWAPTAVGQRQQPEPPWLKPHPRLGMLPHPPPASKAPAAPTPPPSAGTPPPTRQPSSQPRPPASQDTEAQPPATQGPANQPTDTGALTEHPASEAEQRDGPPASSGAAITLDQLTSSFSDILDELPQRVRARFRLGKFVALDGDSASFGLPNAHVIDRCEEVKPDVEAALAAKFNRPVRISLVVDGDSTTTSAPPSSAPTARPAKAKPEPVDEAVEEVGDISELENAPDVASTGIERLTQAFPGAEVIEPND